MFSFLRRYQRAIFLLITTIIILSFSFFGTYSAVVNTKGDDPVVFTTISGRKIHKHEYMAYLTFLSTGAMGGHSQMYNFFNDGFLERDILSTCVGQSILRQWKETVSAPLIKKKAQEAHFVLYQHPKAPFLGTEYVWTYFIPELKDRYVAYQKETSLDSETLFKEKSALFVLEKQFPGNFVKQLLMYQQQQAKEWLESDVTLAEKDLSLFGYGTAADWFGEEFMQKVVETVVNGAERAQKEGISLSDAEVTNSLYQNVQAAVGRFTDLKDKSMNELVQMSTRSLGVDFSTVQKIWHDALLFRQAYTNLPNHVALSCFPFRETYEKGAAFKKIENYSLQPCLHVRSFQDLAELYLWQKAVLTHENDSELFLGAYRSPQDVMASWPEFVEERFCLSYRMIGPEQLEPLIRLKDLWTWQQNEQNFMKLAEKFPRLLEEKREDAASRMEAIEQLPSAIRLEVDALSKKLFLLDHPEWMDEQMNKQEFISKTLFIRPKGEIKELVGITNPREFADMLRKAPIGEKNEASPRYTQDGAHFYEIVVLDRSGRLEIAPLIQVREDGTLTRVFEKLLEAQYPILRKQNPKAFLNDKGDWRPFQEIKLALVDVYLMPLFKVLDAMKPEMEKQYPTLCHWQSEREARMALFFLPLVLDNMKKLEEGAHAISDPIEYEEIISCAKEAFERAQQTLFDFVQTSDKIRRDQVEREPQLLPLFAENSKKNELLVFMPRMGLSFLKVVGEGQDSYDNELRSTVYSLGDFVSESARREKVETLFQLMAKK